VFVDPDGSVRTRQSKRAYDPFEQTMDQLLLAESFARLDLEDHMGLRRWVMEHGALDRAGFWGDPSPNYPPRTQRQVVDRHEDIAAEQSTVRRLLSTLAALSEHRLDGRWDTPGNVAAGDGFNLPGGVAGTPGDDRASGSTWAEVVEQSRQVLTPYVANAVERTFLIEGDEQETVHGRRTVLVPREWRIWGSILAPISLQLFESLRRITEGEPGAAVCRECGEPFLRNDARRRLFCNEAHRHRYTQRRRRRRLAQERSVDAPADTPA
jgi:hypothetical protein